MMAPNTLDLPLQTMPGGRVLGFLLGALIYAAITLLSIAAISDTVIRFYHSQPVLMTLALPPAPATAKTVAQTEKIIELLRGLEGVVFANALEPEATDKFVGLWAGEADIALAVPRLVDVGMTTGIPLDLASIDEKLRALTPGVAMGEAIVPGSDILPLAIAARTLTLALGVGCLVLSLLSTGLCTGVGVGRQATAVGLLRQMGATDGYIARQFEHFALLQGLKGAALGFALAAGTIASGIYIFNITNAKPVTAFGLEPLDWVFFAFIPAIIGLLIIPVARLSALWTLRSLQA